MSGVALRWRTRRGSPAHAPAVYPHQEGGDVGTFQLHQGGAGDAAGRRLDPAAASLRRTPSDAGPPAGGGVGTFGMSGGSGVGLGFGGGIGSAVCERQVDLPLHARVLAPEPR